MRAINFKEATIVIAENQPEYQPLPAYYGQLGDQSGQSGFVTCFELSDEELETVKKYGKIWHAQLTFGQPMQPIQMFVHNDFFDTTKDSENGTRTKIKSKTIDFEKLPEVFRGLEFGKTPQTSDIIFIFKNGVFSGTIRYYEPQNHFNIYLKSGSENKYFQTNFPFYSWEQFRLDMERIGLSLTYINDEEN